MDGTHVPGTYRRPRTVLASTSLEGVSARCQAPVQQCSSSSSSTAGQGRAAQRQGRPRGPGQRQASARPAQDRTERGKAESHRLAESGNKERRVDAERTTVMIRDEP
jgi:hypothetical protein